MGRPTDSRIDGEWCQLQPTKGISGLPPVNSISPVPPQKGEVIGTTSPRVHDVEERFHVIASCACR